ncbi:MAG: serine/threonine protein kinase [Actinobacteria bacterium]|nr:serine/threonine protein kinase [Actinomycetota bacterium]
MSAEQGAAEASVPAPSEAPELHGQYLAKPSYTFLQSINEGAAGECYRYRHEVFEHDVVAKTVGLFGIPGSLTEPQLLKNLRHDNLLTVREAQWTPDMDPSLKVVTFTTDYCEGQSVYTALEEGHVFSIREAVTICSQVLAALDYMHVDHGLLHRDVKPGNVMLDGSRTTGILGDLGSVAALTDGASPAGAGTLAYLPPESAAGELYPCSDVYSAGMVLIEMLNGRYDWESVDEAKMEVNVDCSKRALPQKFYKLAPWVPPAVATVARAMTDPDPDRRPGSAAEARRRLDDARYVDWRRIDGSNLLGVWEGTWPPGARVRQLRRVRITAAQVEKGRYAGQVKLQASWRGPGPGAWRGYARLDRRVARGDSAALARFFRAVEEAAQAAPVR